MLAASCNHGEEERRGLPDWAKTMWEDMGSPKLEGFKSVYNGDLVERRQGLRRDDFVELHLNVQAFSDPEDAHIRGRLISSGKSSLEILTDDGRCVLSHGRSL